MSLGLDHLQEMYGAVIDSFLDVVDEGTWKHRERILDTPRRGVYGAGGGPLSRFGQRVSLGVSRRSGGIRRVLRSAGPRVDW